MLTIGQIRGRKWKATLRHRGGARAHAMRDNVVKPVPTKNHERMQNQGVMQETWKTVTRWPEVLAEFGEAQEKSGVFDFPTSATWQEREKDIRFTGEGRRRTRKFACRGRLYRRRWWG